MILASVTLGLISAASGWGLVYISMTCPAPCISVSILLPHTHILDLHSQGLKLCKADILTGKKGGFNLMYVTGRIHKNIYKESLAVFTLSDGYDGMRLSIFTWKTLLRSNWFSALDRNTMVQCSSLKNLHCHSCEIVQTHLKGGIKVFFSFQWERKKKLHYCTRGATFSYLAVLKQLCFGGLVPPSTSPRILGKGGKIHGRKINSKRVCGQDS